MEDLTADGGVKKEILTAGEGEENPPKGSTVTAHYHGTLLDGTVFDSSVERGQPFEFKLGVGQVIKGWDIGMATMKKGEKARLTITSEYAYGDQGSPPKIPKKATLIFEITLISWVEEDLSESSDGGVRRTILTAGSGYDSPADLALCKIHVKGTHDGRVFDERDLSFMIGEGNELGLPRGVETALKHMMAGEKSRITLSPKYGWPAGCEKYNIPPNTTLKYEITLEEFEKEKGAWDMDSEDKLKEAQLLKNKATEYFTKQSFSMAAKMYNKAQEYIEKGDGFNEAEETERKKLLLALRLNLALVSLKMNESYQAKQYCDGVLELDPKNVKGLFRRGQALLGASEPEKAKLDFEHLLEIEPNNAAAKSLLSECKKKIKDMQAKERQIYVNMFEKFATKDKEAYHYGWWDDSGKQPVVEEILELPDEKALAEERKRDKKKQLEHLKRIAERKRKEREEEEALAKEVKTGESPEEAEEAETAENSVGELKEIGEEVSKSVSVDAADPAKVESETGEKQLANEPSNQTGDGNQQLIINGAEASGTPPDSTG